MSTAVKKKSAALDKIVVKRPVPPPELLQGAPPPNAFNPEFEQKPLAELNLQTSEDFHGGSEQTFSMPSRQGGGGGGTQQQGAGVQQHQDFGGDFRQQEDGEAGSEDVRQDGAWQQRTKGVQQQKGSDAEQQSPGSEEAEGGAQQASWQQEDAQQHRRSHTSEGDVEEWEEFDRDVEEGGGDQMGAFNTEQVVNVEERSQMPGLRRLQTEFYRVLEMLAEEKTRYFDPSLVGGLVKAEYNVKKMALRRYEGKPPTRYKAPRVREAVVLLLDNSGSMFSWADMLRAMAELAAKRRDVEVYLAPNGYVEEQIAPVRRKVNHDEFMKKTSGRKIIYVGDFDGANTPIELSRHNEVIWIAPESRYKRFKSHSWVKYDESKYKGAFIRAFTVDGIMKGLKKVLGGTKWIDMCMKCEDE
ncbi:MAG: hypothetical protein ACO2PN_24365 [Pyrobaculum sp.]|jgi:hypothetical protein